MNKKNEDLLQSIQRMEEKIKNLTRENVEMVSHGPRALVSAWAPPASDPSSPKFSGATSHPPPHPNLSSLPLSPEFTALWASVPNGACTRHLTAGLHFRSAISMWGP